MSSRHWRKPWYPESFTYEQWLDGWEPLVPGSPLYDELLERRRAREKKACETMVEQPKQDTDLTLFESGEV